MKKKRVGLYGGTFSPPHSAHVRSAVEFVRALELDLLYVMPANIPPHKVMEYFVPAEKRYEMCRLAFCDVPKTVVSDYEITRSGVSYTVDTLRHLSDESSEVFMLCGDDMFLTLECWRSPEEIFRLAHIVCMRRYDTDAAPLLEKAEKYKNRYGARVTFIDAVPHPMSSTQIRQALSKNDELAQGCLAPSVAEYIREHSLYTDESNRGGNDK